MTRNIKSFKVGIYSPYLNIFGGGERYLLNIANSLSRENEVFLFSDKSVRQKSNAVFNISLERVQFLPSKIFGINNLLKKLSSIRQFDIFFYMTDGSLFFSPCEKNFLIIQSPDHIPVLTVLNKLKLRNWKIICYSQFMAEIIKKKLNRVPIILSPAIDTEVFKCNIAEKKNIILSVGRFFSHLHNKKHNVLVEVFKKNYKKMFKNWQLVIAGGLTDSEGERLVALLKKKSENFPIEILTNVSFNELKSLYQRTKIYWHAAGFGEDTENYPQKAEHFGITTLEAMASGCVPLVYAAGGQKDIVTDGGNGYLWINVKELVGKARKLIENGALFKSLSISAQMRAQEFSQAKFYEKLNQIIAE